MNQPIPVLCDCCRAEGVAGEGDFAHLEDLRDFEPVPRRKRAGGWTPEVQRFFIIALAATGSERQAAHAVGRAQYGVTQLKEAEGNEGFLRAHARALEIHAADNTHRLAEGVRAATVAGASWRGRPPAWSGAATRRQALPPPALIPSPDAIIAQGAEGLTPKEEQVRMELLNALLGKYLIKLASEREARLRGEIVAADFYLRQITALEVSLDVVSGNGMAILRDARLDGHDLRHIAETDMSRLLDQARHLYWIKQGDPPRPEVVSAHLLQEQDGYATEYGEGDPGLKPGHEEKRRVMTEQMKRDAEAQIAWEAEARHDYERRRDSDAAHNQEPGSAGQPAP